jgi:hypothetical protein
VEREYQDKAQAGVAGDETSDGSPAQQALAARLARLRDVAPPDPPAAVEARLRASLATRRTRRSRGRLAGVGAAVLAAAAAAAVGLFLTPMEPPVTVVQAPGTGAPTARIDRSAPSPGRFRPLGVADGAVFTHAARVELAAETAAYFGWPVAADVPRARVQVEVLFGDDGVARGLRFLPASFRSLPLPQERDRQGVNP